MYLLLAWRNIWRNKRRTLITLASIVFAVFFACLMQAMQLGSYDSMISTAVRFYTGHIQIHAKGYWEEKSIDNSFQQDADILRDLERLPQVDVVVPRLESFALVSSGVRTRGTMVVGIDPERENRLTSLQNTITAGAYLTTDEPQALIGQGLAEFLNAGIGDTIVLIGQGYHGINAAGKYAVRGIVKLPSPDLNNQIVYLPLGEAQYLYGAHELLSSYSLVLQDDDDIPDVMEAIRRRVNVDTHEFMDWREMMPEMVQTMEFDYRSGLVLLFILYAVVGFGIFGTFLMMTAERRYEFGIMMASGMKRSLLQIVTIVEIVMLALGGVFGGLLLSLPLVLYLHFNPIPVSGDLAKAYERFGMEPIIPFSVDPDIFLQQFWVILAITLLLGVYPIWFIYRLDIVRAIRR